MPHKKSKKKTEPTVSGILGLGLDSSDVHKRITRTDEMVLVGGSEETHEWMRETAIRFGEELEKRGKLLRETPLREAIEMLRDAMVRTG